MSLRLLGANQGEPQNALIDRMPHRWVISSLHVIGVLIDVVSSLPLTWCCCERIKSIADREPSLSLDVAFVFHENLRYLDYLSTLESTSLLPCTPPSRWLKHSIFYRRQ